MTMDRPAPAAAKTKPVLRTTDETTGRIRTLIAQASAKLGGRRVTQEELIAALATLAEKDPEKLIEILSE